MEERKCERKRNGEKPLHLINHIHKGQQNKRKKVFSLYLTEVMLLIKLNVQLSLNIVSNSCWLLWDQRKAQRINYTQKKIWTVRRIKQQESSSLACILLLWKTTFPYDSCFLVNPLVPKLIFLKPLAVLTHSNID